MNHICSKMSSLEHRSNSDVYTCGGCGEIFSSICLLHQHMTGHSFGGSYHFDNIINIAFPKYDSTCASTQTDEIQTKYLQQIDFTGKDGLLTDSRQKRLAKLSETKVNAKKGHVNLGPLSSDTVVDKLNQSVGREGRLEIEKNNLLFATDSNERLYTDIIPTVSECFVRIKKLTEGDLNSCLKEKHEIKYGSYSKKENVSSTKSSPHFTDILSEINEKDMDDDEEEEYHDDDDDHGDNCNINVNNYLAENVHENASNFEETTDFVLKNPNTVSVFCKSREKITLSEPDNNAQAISTSSKEKERFKEFISNTKNKKHILERGDEETKADNLSAIKQECHLEIGTDSNCDMENMNSDENESHTMKEKEYFYGKITSSDFVIERIKPTQMFFKGEKDEYNWVHVDYTWHPSNALISESVPSTNKQSFSEWSYGLSEDVDINDLSKEEVKHLRKKLKYKQRPKLICNHCGKSFKNTHHFEGHMNSHAGHKPYMCHYCGKSYPNKSTLLTHEQHKHSDKTTWFKCSICNEKSFPTAARLQAHEKTHSTEYVHICDTCNKSYKSLNLLNAHIAYSHNKKKFRCSNCKKSFDTMEEHDSHQKDKHDVVIKCVTCGRQFTSFRSKQRHEKIHLGVKPHECHICLRRFLQKTPFWVHMEKHHDLTKKDLIRLFPEKHLNKNQQHLIKEMNVTEHHETETVETIDYCSGDNELIEDMSE